MESIKTHSKECRSAKVFWDQGDRLAQAFHQFLDIDAQSQFVHFGHCNRRRPGCVYKMARWLMVAPDVARSIRAW